MIDQVWKVIQVRISLLINELSRNHKWRQANERIKQAKELRRIKVSSLEEVIGLEKVIKDQKVEIQDLKN